MNEEKGYHEQIKCFCNRIFAFIHKHKSFTYHGVLLCFSLYLLVSEKEIGIEHSFLWKRSADEAAI